MSEDKNITKRTSPLFMWLILGDVEEYGFRRAYIDLVETLSKRSVEVVFVSFYEGSFSRELKTRGYTVVPLGGVRSGERSKGSGLKFIVDGVKLAVSAFSFQSQIRQAVVKYRPDWIHVSNNSLMIAGGLASRISKIPAYWHLHNTILSKLPLHMQPTLYQVLCKVLGVQPIANSRHTAASLGNTFCKPKVCYPGVDTAHYSIAAKFPTIRREDIGVESDLPLFVIAARMNPNKAQDRVVEAAIRIYKEGPKFSLLLVGGPLDSDFSRRIISRVKEEGYEDLIKFTGQVSDVRPYFLEADVIVNSRVDAEPFGLSAVEGMLMGRPVLAYKLGGPSETVVDGLTGWHVDDPSIESYQNGLLRALKYRRYWPKMGGNARRIAASRFSLSETTETYMKIVGAIPDVAKGDTVLEEELAGKA